MNKNLNIRDEEILLLGLCRLDFNVELKVMLMALAENLTDWSYFVSLADAHGVAALVYNNLEKLKFLQYLPKDGVEHLHNALLMSLSRNTHFTESVDEVLKLLNKENIKMVLLKGMALELSVYGNAGLRQMTDVDVLMTREDCLKARKVLMNNEFVSLPVKSVFHKPILADTGKHLPTLIRNDFLFELHHELFGAGKNILTKMLYEASHEIVIKGEKSFLPEPQIFFLYLVKHLYLHEMNNESQLRLYADLVVLIEKHRDEIINYELLEYAIQAGMQEILAWRLEPLRDLWGISFPDWVNDFINKWYNPDSINRFVFFLKSPKDNPSGDRAWLYRHHLSEIPGFHRKALYVFGDLFPTFDFMKKRYDCRSRWKALLYYPLRWGKLWYLVKGAKA
jgi:hypothetical protein